MARYHLNIRDGDELIEDFEGCDLPDLDAARGEALASAREILADRLKAGMALNGQIIEITDDEGTVLEKVPLADALKVS